MRIFISYGHQDALEFAEKLAKWLKKEGFEPWLDKKDGIISGEPFDIRIEQGISESKLLIALISPWSIRQESYCRNEWLFAQSIEKPIIPVRLANINPPLVIINLHYEDAFDKPEVVFDKILPVIKEVAANGKPRYKEWVQENQSKFWWSQREKINFDKELSRYGESFTGREWLFKQLEEWVSKDESQLALINADSGLGKSAIAAQLTTKLNVRSVHFCTSSNIKTCEPVEWLKEVIYQLAAQFEVYRIEMEKRSTLPNWGTLPESLFRSLIIDPLIHFEKELDTTDPWVFVIDSLDESLSVAGPALTDLLVYSVNLLPPWIKIIATCRPHKSLISRFSIEGVKHFKLEASDLNNKKDLLKYVEKRFRQIGELESSTVLSTIVHKIASISEGNFQYAKVLIDSLRGLDKENGFSIEQLDKFPANLIGLYDRIFRKRYSDLNSYRKNVLPIINCLIAIKEPLSEAFLIKSSKLDEVNANSALLILSQFLNSTDTGLRLFHQSIIDWLSDVDMSSDFTASKANGQKLLAEFCWLEFKKNPEKMSSYSRKYIAVHLKEAERWDDLLEIINNVELKFIKIWTEGSQGDVGITCLNALIEYLMMQNKERATLAGLATQLARIYSLRGDYSQAGNLLNIASEKTSLLHARRIKAIALHELGSLALYKRNFKIASQNYKKAFQMCNWGIPKYHDEAASNLIGLATVAFEKYQLKESIRRSNRAILRAKKGDDIDHIIAAERMIGAAFKSIGNYQEAVSHLDNAHDMCELINNRRESYRILLLKGWLELDLAAMNMIITEKARPLFEEALESARNSMDHYCSTEALLSIGWTYLKESNEREAKYCLDEATKGMDMEMHPELKAGVDSWQVTFYYLNKEYAKAMDLGFELVIICKKLDIRTWLSRLLIILGAINWNISNTDEAQNYWDEAIKVSKSISIRRLKLAHAGIEMCKKDPLWVPQ